MHRISRTLALAALVSIACAVSAQDSKPEWSPRTGDAWVDAHLVDINQYGARYREAFIDEINRYYGAPRDLVSQLLLEHHWMPGDVYYACALAQAAGQPCRSVADVWQQDPAQGWDAIAQRIGVQPGSPGFARLKTGIERSYQHWARPVALDDGHGADDGMDKDTPKASDKARHDKDDRRGHDRH